jgi:sugar (pentulose or hexulose) kinase
MLKEVIAVFDIGKTNKKFLLFDADLNILLQEEQKFDEITDEDGVSCDDIAKIESWMRDSVSRIIHEGKFIIKALNFTTYGASLMYLDKDGRRLTPVYNYLKSMPDDVLEGFYESYGGKEEFCRKTASPALGMLNSGLQILWLKRKKPDVFSKVTDILHFPQYLSYVFTREKVSEYTSIGCHTAMWDFDNHRYHKWLEKEGIYLPKPLSNSQVSNVIVDGNKIKTGIGIHDSSSSLVPYFMGTKDQFILMSTGTWCIMMNPFNTEPLTAEQLRKDSLCYMSIQQKQVKSSRLFLGHMHDVNVDRISNHFIVDGNFYKTVKASKSLLASLLNKSNERIFFADSIPEDFIDHNVDLTRFNSFDEAYHCLMHDLVSLVMESLNLIIPVKDQSRIVYISGGFARNEIFMNLLASLLPTKKVYTSEIDNATALGAAMVVWETAFGELMPTIDLGLKRVIGDR